MSHAIVETYSIVYTYTRKGFIAYVKFKFYPATYFCVICCYKVIYTHTYKAIDKVISI